MTRPEQFNTYTAQIFSELYKCFPTRVDADALAQKILKVELITEEAHNVYSTYRVKDSGDYYPRQEVDYLCDCIEWLCDERYLCCKEQGVTLSSKGLNILQRVPEHTGSDRSYAQLLADCARQPEQARSLVMDMFAHFPEEPVE